MGPWIRSLGSLETPIGKAVPMSFLRTISTQRLIALLVAAALVAGGGTAIALAAGGGGRVPPARPLDRAVQAALAAPEPSGVTAQIEFTNHLVDSAGLEGSAPLLKGGSGRLWLSGRRLRVEVQSDRGDAQIVSDGRSFSVYDSTSNTVYRGSLPQERASKRAAGERRRTPSLKEIRDGIARLARQADVSGAVPGNVAGRPAYSVRVSPRNGGLVDSGQLAWDALRGAPLRVGIYARGSASPVLELQVKGISYGPVAAKDFNVSPPRGAKVVDVSTPDAKGARRKGRSSRREVSGRAAVAQRLPFKLAAPSALAGQRLESVRLIGSKGSPGAVARYGRGLGGIAVIQRPAEPAKAARPPGEGRSRHSLTLPRVSVNGVSAEELATPLGTMLRFDRGGVSYVVVGSVGKAAAESAARGLHP